MQDEDHTSLHDEVLELFRNENRKANKAARRTPNLLGDNERRFTDCNDLWDESQVNKK